MGADWGSPITMGSEPSSDSDDMKASASASHGLGPPMASEKRCVQCGQTKPIDDFTESGRHGRGWCQVCRDSHNASTKAKRKAAKEAAKEAGEEVSSTRSKKVAKPKRSIPQSFEDAYGDIPTKRKAVGGMASNDGPSKPPKRNTYTFKERQCCGFAHHWKSPCPTAPPADMHNKQWRILVPGVDYSDHEPDREFDMEMPGRWLDQSPLRRVRRKKVACLPSSQTPAATHETTQRPWMASSAPDGLQGLREVVKASSEVVEPNYVHKHHKVPRTSIDLGIQCRIPPECIVSTEDGDFTVISFVPKGETRIAIPRDIN